MSNEKSNSKSEKKFYNPFNPLPEGKDENECRFKLVPTSNMYVRRVCDVMAKRRGISDNQRVQYADQAGYQNVSEKNESAVETLELLEDTIEDEDRLENLRWALYRIRNFPEVELHDVYSEYHVYAALAQVLFQGFPKVVEVSEKEDHWEINIIDKQLFDRIDQGVVNEAFLSFNNDRSGIRQSLAAGSQK